MEPMELAVQDLCYQCGTCTGDCPVAWVSSEFNPRKLVQMLDMNKAWLCVGCYKCLRCPRDLKPVEIFSELRKKAIDNNEEHKGVKLAKAFAEVIKENGKLIETKLIMKFLGIEAIKMLPPSIAFKMWRSGKINIGGAKAKCAEEVKELFEVCAHA